MNPPNKLDSLSIGRLAVENESGTRLESPMGVPGAAFAPTEQFVRWQEHEQPGRSKLIRELAKSALTTPLGWQIGRFIREPGLTVLMYHRISKGQGAFESLPVENFRTQMQWLRRFCRPIWPEEVRAAAQSRELTRPPVLVTFDDGYRDYHDYAYPILKELEIPAVVFLATQAIDSGELIWTERLHWAALVSQKASITLPWQPTRVLALGSMAERMEFVSHSKAHLKATTNSQRRVWLEALIQDLGVPEASDELERQMLNWDEVRSTMDWTRYGGHSHTHPILSQLDEHEMDGEIRTCSERIKAETGVAPTLFAYPNGRACDFTDTTKALLIKHGMTTAFSTIEGINGPGFDALEFRRQPTGLTTGALAARIGRK